MISHCDAIYTSSLFDAKQKFLILDVQSRSHLMTSQHFSPLRVGGLVLPPI